ncbi:MAG: ABC transporter substrate-binding protein [Sulfurimonas sp.]|nr:ABC transporter substrate-binding protein [Sulfurimonas sp.]
MKKIVFIFFLLFCVSVFAQNTKRELLDMSSRVISLDKEIKGVVTIGGTPAVNAFLFAIGKANLIKNGVENNNLRKLPIWENQTFFQKNIFDLPQVSSNPPDWNPNYEALLSMEFDIGFVNSALMADKLEKKGIKTAVINWDKPDSIKKTMIFLGELFQEEKRVEKYLDYYNNNTNMIQSVVNNHNIVKKKAIYLRLDNLSIPMISTANELLQKAGASTPTADLIIENASLNIEKLLVWNPDVLFVWSKNDIKIALADERFKNLTAVKNKEIYVVPMGAHMWTHYTPEQPLAALWCAKKMYPESFIHIDIYEEAREFYKEFMNEELSETQLNSILNK